uniref:Uncharacterized protein n=1 Tax=viral metagenome TaxID=1070528 RepID=A0A6M3LRR4_9ZZZZ
MLTEIKITKNDHLFAKKSTDKIQSALENSGLRSRFNTDEYENRYTGQLGECIFSRWLTNNDIKFDWQSEVTGRADDYDFIIKGHIWDVKTNIRRYPMDNFTQNGHYDILLHKYQLKAKTGYYFWILIQTYSKPQHSNIAYLCGCMPGSAVHDYPVTEKIKGVPCYAIPINDLINTEDSLNLMRFK